MMRLLADRGRALLATLASGLLLLSATPSAAVDALALEPPLFRASVDAGKLPPTAMRLPATPLKVDLVGRGRTLGKHGGMARTLVSRARDLRFMTVVGYARLVVYNERFELVPDILDSIENEGNRVFTLTLRAGHRWSDGHPFTTEDFRYYWEDIAGNKDLTPAGPPEVFLVDGKPPVFEVLDERRVRFTWPGQNPRFMPHLAQPRPVFIYAPAHYLKQFHPRYTNAERLKEMAAKAKVRSWAALHNRLDDPYENSNPAMPTLSPWRVVTAAPADRFIFERNPYYHRVDAAGRQLPYVDRLAVDVAAPGLFAAKANAGDVDLMFRGLSMADLPVLKEGEAMQPYRTLLWRGARGSTYALYPNLTVTDPVWRTLNRDVRYRRALSLAIDRRLINNALLFGLGHEGNNTVDPASPMFDEGVRKRFAKHDPAEANRLLDEIGLTQRAPDGTRKLPDGRLLEIVVEMDGEGADLVDALQLIEESWRDVGVKLFAKPQDRVVLRNRSYSGLSVMIASGGLENAIATPLMPPHELAPVRQDHYAWPKWGQFVETKGKNGEAIDLPEAARLKALFEGWMDATDKATKADIWRQMLALHADQQFVIGTVSGEIQPVVVARSLRNVPDKGLFSWEPSALIGVYRPDEFYFE
jgi:peptide/nickel transport system substrate-binding protein